MLEPVAELLLEGRVVVELDSVAFALLLAVVVADVLCVSIDVRDAEPVAVADFDRGAVQLPV